MNKDNINIYNGYILNEKESATIRPPHRSPDRSRSTWQPPSPVLPAPAKDKPIGTGTVLRPPEKEVPHNPAIDSALNPTGSTDRDLSQAVSTLRGIAPSTAAPAPAPPLVLPDPSIPDTHTNSRVAASGRSPTRPDAAELAQMNKDTGLAKPMPGNWRNASWSKNSRRMSGNLASNARLKKAAQAEWDKRESRRLEKGGQVAPKSRTSKAIDTATPPPVKPAAKQPARNTFGSWLKSLAPGGARPGDNIPGRVKQRKVDPNRPAFTGADSWKQQKATKRIDRKARRAQRRANKQSRREARWNRKTP